MNEIADNPNKALRLAYFSQETNGGLTDYAQEQARALSQAGARVSFVTAPSVAAHCHNVADEVVLLLGEVPVAATSNRWRRPITGAWL